ncbi:MAG: hypothetical protein Q8S22_07240, partial [Eubacteriales bacterium]|nr:hypothetical protein [Eubacteriales bacterium]
MYEMVKDFPNEIIYKEVEPCVSLYQTTHRHGPENKKDRIVFKQLVQQIEESLKQKYEKSEVQQIMNPFSRLKDDPGFWMHTLDGMAMLASRDECIVYLLSSPVENLAIVSGSFHIKPLIRYFQAANTYCLLGLGSNSISLFEGNRYGVKEIELGEEIANEIAEMNVEEHADGFLTHGSYGGAEGVAMFHGHGGRKDAIEKDLERFFRYVDKTVMEKFSKQMKVPLILVSLEEHQGAFRKISNNPYLLQQGIALSYESLDLDQITKKAWDIMEPHFLNKTQKLADRYNNAKANALGSDVLLEVARAVFEGRVETLLVEADRIMPGRFDASTGKLEFGNIDDPECGDIIDYIVKAVMKDKG